jgi:cytochrome c-type biogenesis protein
MSFGLGSYAIAGLAGVLSTLSPCVLPLIPIIIGSSLQEHRLGPFAVGFGMACSFALIGTFLASIGASIGLSQDSFRVVAGILMLVLGVILISKNLQERFAVASSGLSSMGNQFLQRVHIEGLKGQLLVGILLGLVWSPCVGPTLGAAITLASQGTSLVSVALIMSIFGIGAAIPIIGLGLLSRQAMLKRKSQLQNVGGTGKVFLGIFLIWIAVGIFTGYDKVFEAFLTEHSPDWLTQLTTSF